MRCDGCAWLRLEDLLHQPAALPHACTSPEFTCAIRRADSGESRLVELDAELLAFAAAQLRRCAYVPRTTRWPPLLQLPACGADVERGILTSWDPLASWVRVENLELLGDTRAYEDTASTRRATTSMLLALRQRALANTSLHYADALADDVRIAIRVGTASPQTIWGVLAPSVANASAGGGVHAHLLCADDAAEAAASSWMEPLRRAGASTVTVRRGGGAP